MINGQCEICGLNPTCCDAGAPDDAKAHDEHYRAFAGFKHRPDRLLVDTRLYGEAEARRRWHARPVNNMTLPLRPEAAVPRIPDLRGDDAEKIRRTLRSPFTDPSDVVEMKCFNREEVDEISARLAPEERQRVRFTWLTWPERSAVSR